MIAFLTLCYLGVLAILVALRVLPNKPIVWMSTLVWSLFLFVVLFVPMQWGAPSGPARVVTATVQIIPNVAGEVTEVPVQPNVPLNKGDVLFSIDPTPYEAAVDATGAALAFQEQRLAQYRDLAARDAATRFQVEQTEAQVARLTADLRAAQWNLDQTTVRAPGDGFVTYLALRPGQRVLSMPFQPAMTFLDTSERVVGVQLHQIYLRHVAPGQPVELTFKTRPGQVFSGTVQAVLEVTAGAQAQIGGTVPLATRVHAEPFFVRVALDDDTDLAGLPPGSAGTAAIYTDAVTPTHIIRKVMIRMDAIVSYVWPGL